MARPADVGGLDPPGSSPTRVALVLEQHLGHETYGAYLREHLTAQPALAVTWIPIRYGTPVGWRRRVPSAIRATATVRATIREHAADQDVHLFNTQVPAVIGGRAARRHPYVVCTDVTPVQYDLLAAGYGHHADSGPLRTIKHAWNRHVLRGATAHAPWSAWVQRSLIDDYGVDASRIEVIPPGIDVEAWRPASASASASAPLRVLFVGGDFQRKGGDLLLRALAGQPGLDWALDVVTNTDVPSHERVTTHRGLSPNDPRLIELYRSASVFALPSRAETFGIAAVEAAAAGLVAVVSDVGALPEIVRHGDTGIVVPVGDEAALGAALRRLADHPEGRHDMAVRARRSAELRFSARTNAARMAGLIERVAATGPTSGPVPAPPG